MLGSTSVAVRQVCDPSYLGSLFLVIFAQVETHTKGVNHQPDPTTHCPLILAHIWIDGHDTIR